MKHHCVLLVDDEPNVLLGLKRGLRRESFEILTAGSAQEAMEDPEGSAGGRGLSPIRTCPGCAGQSCLTRVHQQWPQTIRMILTGQASLDVAITAINQGAISQFLTKPCDARELAMVIRQSLERRDLAEGARQLLQTVKRQRSELDLLEQSVPGITKVKRDAEGAVVIDEVPTDFAQLIQEINAQLDGDED